MYYKDYQELAIKCVKKYSAPAYTKFMLTDDVLSTIFTQIVKAGERYDSTKTKMTKEQWCVYNGKFAVFDFFSKMKYKKLPKTDFKLDNSIPDKIISPLQQLINQEEINVKKQNARTYLSQLKLTNKEQIVAYSLIDGLNFEEISKMHNMSKQSIQFIFRRLKDKIWAFNQTLKKES